MANSEIQEHLGRSTGYFRIFERRHASAQHYQEPSIHKILVGFCLQMSYIERYDASYDHSAAKDSLLALKLYQVVTKLKIRPIENYIIAMIMLYMDLFALSEQADNLSGMLRITDLKLKKNSCFSNLSSIGEEGGVYLGELLDRLIKRVYTSI